jgi:NADH:ubiquinone oxidoreductase subunit E
MNKEKKFRSVHPGSSGKSALFFGKGRTLLPEDSKAIENIIGVGPYERHMLIEYLHLIQDQEGHLSEGYMQALAKALRIPMAEVYEVATFYAHFDVTADGQKPPAPLTIRVCDSISCALANSEQLIKIP